MSPLMYIPLICSPFSSLLHHLHDDDPDELQLCCKCALHLCHCKKKNDCQSVETVVDAAYNIFKQEKKKTG